MQPTAQPSYSHRSPADGGVEGTEFGPYRLLAVLGMGGYSHVFRAEKIGDESGRTVALKVARDRSGKKRHKVSRALSNEARIMSRLSHPNLVQVHEFGEVDGRYYIAMDLVEGLTLRRVLSLCRRRKIFFGPVAAAEVARQIAAGLRHAHNFKDDGVARTVIHRDLKPGNVMVTKYGAIKLMDFSVAKWPLAEVSTTVGIIKGTPLYMAPEQVRARPLTPASDIFSLGAVLYQMLTNRPLFQASDTRDVLRQVSTADISSQLLWIPEDCRALVPVLEGVLTRDPRVRIPTADAFTEALDDALQSVDEGGDLKALLRSLFSKRPRSV